MDLIKRYLNALAEHLPHEAKDEILKEVEANIYDMLQNDFSDENINRVLMELGDPRILSRNYKGGHQYLIGPDYYDFYIRALKFICPLAVVVFFCLGLLPVFTSLDHLSVEEGFARFFEDGIGSAFEGALEAFFITTVVFIVMERTDRTVTGDLKFMKREPWTPAQLANVPVSKPYKFKRGDAIAEIIFSVLGTILFFTFAQELGWYVKVDGQLVMNGVFFTDRIYFYMGFMIILVAALVVISFLKLIMKYPNYRISVLIAIQRVASAIISIILLNDPLVFDAGFRLKAIEAMQITPAQYDHFFLATVNVLTFLIILGTVVDIVKVFIQSYKNERCIRQD